MNHVYRSIQKKMLFVFSALLFTVPAFSQFSLVSTVPTNGAVNVAIPTTFQLTFSSALDTTAQFHEPEGFFLQIDIFPDDTTSEPDISLSADLKTVTISGFQLLPDTQYNVLLSAARGATGDFLDRPYALTFSTGSSLPTGSVSGNVTFNGSPAENAVVALFPDLSSETPVAFGVVTAGTFTIPFVADGTYFPFAAKDTNGDFDIDPSTGDASGVYDANADGRPDSIQVLGGNSISGVNITLTEPTPSTAQNSFADVQNAALSWSSDAVLVSVGSDNIDPQGTSFGWSFVFYSSNLNAFRDFFLSGGLLVENDYNGTHLPITVALPDIWVDSDVAAALAEANGGSDFRSNHGDADVNVNLEYYDFFSSDSSITPTTTRVPVWHFNYWSDAAQKYLNVDIEAEAGHLLATDAMSNLDAANQAAALWASDATFIKIENRWNLTSDGLSNVWGFNFQSVALNSTLEFLVASGKVIGTQPQPNFGIWPYDPLNSQLCNSTDAFVLAQTESETFRAQHPDYFMVAQLSRNIAPKPEVAVWQINYDTNSGDHFEVLIDAETCNLYTSVKENAAVPSEFRLQQNYPNPFNPTTEISYELPQAGFVQLSIFNLLGQKISTLVNERQTAGSYHVNWNGLDEQGKQVPTGLYIYRLKSDNRVQVKKMVLTR